MSTRVLRHDGVRYDEDGLPRYHQLYPLMDGYWNKSLCDMPEEIRLRVEHAVASWDVITEPANGSCEFSQTVVRQSRVISYDIKYDLTQESQTRDGLRAYLDIDDGPLQGRIDNAIAEGRQSVATLLHERVAFPLREIFCKEAVHWPATEPLLWRALCKFSKVNLRQLTEYAECEENKYLIVVMKEVVVDIYKLLGIEYYRVDATAIEAEYAANAAIQTSLGIEKFENIYVGIDSTSSKLNKQLEEDERLVARIVVEREGKVFDQFSQNVLTSKKSIVNNLILKSELASCRNTVADVVPLGAFSAERNVPNFIGVRKSIMRDQERAILKWLADNRYDPLNLPPQKNGKAGLRRDCADALGISASGLFMTRSRVHKAWERLQKFGDLKKQELLVD